MFIEAPFSVSVIHLKRGERMKKIISLITILAIVFLCYYKKDDIYTLYSQTKQSIVDNILSSDEIVEVKYEEYEIREPQFKSCYNALTSKQRVFYRTIYSISQEMTEGFVRLGYNYKDASKDINIAYKAFLYDHPDIFWMPKDYILGTANKGEKEKIAIAFDYHQKGKNYSYTVSKTEQSQMKKKLDTVCDKIVNQTQAFSTDYDKEKYINDFLCDSVTYNENAEFSDTAYGALINGKALCEGYSKAFMLLCNKAGIECELIVGEADGVGHMWNRVNINKKLSYVDVTWNDRSEFKVYTYFNITESQLLFDHKIAPLFTEIKTNIEKNLFNFTEKDCSFTGNTFYEKNNRILWVDYESVAVNGILNAQKNGDNYAEFLFDGQIVINEFKSSPEKFIKRIQDCLENIEIIGYSEERDTLILFFQ